MAKVKKDFGEALRRYFVLKSTTRERTNDGNVPAAPCLPFDLPPVPELVLPVKRPKVSFAAEEAHSNSTSHRAAKQASQGIGERSALNYRQSLLVDQIRARLSYRAPRYANLDSDEESSSQASSSSSCESESSSDGYCPRGPTLQVSQYELRKELGEVSEEVLKM